MAHAHTLYIYIYRDAYSNALIPCAYIQDVLEAKNSAIKDLQYELARVCKVCVCVRVCVCACVCVCVCMCVCVCIRNAVHMYIPSSFPCDAPLGPLT